MRLPRRVPWSLAELEHICSCIYSDESDISSKVIAINKISAWKAITTLPHAIESTLAILVVIVQDNSQTPCSSLLLRQSYSTAILRLVNGLVDPLQAGTYARPMATIAQQLGIPPWLVELRHAATHEDLPSLGLLREAARQSMIWLLHNYFLPIISPPTSNLEDVVPVRPLTPCLIEYKNAMKIMIRDVSLASQQKHKVIALIRDLERWIAESRVAANFVVEESWTHIQSSGSIMTASDPKEIWALGKFCDKLSEKGGLIPLSKKKRQPSADSMIPNKTSISLWGPLLQHIQSLHTDFPFVFCRSFVSSLTGTKSDVGCTKSGKVKRDPSYDAYIACWVMWAIDNWQASSSGYSNLRREVLSHLLQELGRHPSHRVPTAISLLKVLSASLSEFEAVTALLLRPPSQSSQTDWNSSALLIMNKRKNILQLFELPGTSSFKSVIDSEARTQEISISIPGWRLLKENENWTHCPIGHYQSK